MLPAAIWSEQNEQSDQYRRKDTEVSIEQWNLLGEAKPDWEALQLLSIELGKNIAVSIDKVSAEVMKSLK